MSKTVSASDVAALRRALMNLASLMLLMVLCVGIVGLFSVWSLNRYHARTQQALSEVSATMHQARQAQVHFKTQVQEWKNTLLRGHDLKDRATYVAAFEAQRSQTQSRLKELPAQLDRIAHSEALIKLKQGSDSAKLQGVSIQMKDDALQILAEFDAVNEIYRGALTEAQKDDGWNPRIADSIVRGADRGLTERLDGIPVELARAHVDLGLLASREAAGRFETLSRVVWAVIIFALTMVALILWRILRHPALVK
jgi:hypothetical protein